MQGHAYTAPGAAAARSGPPAATPGAGPAMRIAGLCLLGLALVWMVAELVPAAHARDAVTLRDFILLSGPHINGAATFLLELLDPLPLTLWGVVLVLLALARGRRREALAVAIVLGLAPLSADALKPILAHSHQAAGTIRINPASWPSGHATAALALIGCAVLIAPRRWRTLIAVAGGMFVLAVGAALLIRAWHMPSDVLGGYLMAALFIALAVAGLRVADRRWPRAAAGSSEAGS